MSSRRTQVSARRKRRETSTGNASYEALPHRTTPILDFGRARFHPPSRRSPLFERLTFYGLEEPMATMPDGTTRRT